MKKITPIAIFLLINTLTHLSAGEIENRVSKAIIENAQRYSIDPKILYTLISVESAFYPYAIAVETSKGSAKQLEALRSDDIRIKIGKTYHSKLYLVSIFPKHKEDALVIGNLLKSMGFIFDAGLMQINTCNFKQYETSKMFDVEYNIQKGAKILKSCINLFSGFKHQVECYNRGAGNLRKALRKGKNYSPYYRQFVKKWEF